MANDSQVSVLEANTSCLCQTSATYIGLPMFYVLMFLTGVPGNVLSLWIFTAKISTKTPTHIYLFNLGISNLMLCLTMPFLAAYYAQGTSWKAGTSLCQIAINGLTPALHINISTGMTILTFLALSRLATLIQHNHAHRPSRCTKLIPSAIFRQLRHVRFAWTTCLLIWVLVLMGVLPTVVLSSLSDTGHMKVNKEDACYSVPVEVGASVSHTGSLLAIATFFLCFTLVMSSYIAVTRQICRSRRSMAISGSQRVYARVFRNIVIIQIVLVVCLLPHHIFKAVFINMAQLYSPFKCGGTDGCHPLSKYVEAKNSLLCLASFRCCTDPFMYFFLDKTFHKHVCSIWKVTEPPSRSSNVNLDCGQTSQVTNVHQVAVQSQTL